MTSSARRTAIAALWMLAAASAAYGAGWAVSGLIERGTAARATVSVRAAGLDWLRVDADGAVVTLRGAPPDAARAAQAEALAERLERFAAVRVALEAPPRLQTPTADAPRLSILIAPDGVSFSGALPDASARADVRRALEAISDAPVQEMCALTESAPPAGWAATQRAALEAAGRLEHGTVVATLGEVALRGALRDPGAADALDALDARLARQGVRLHRDLAAVVAEALEAVSHQDARPMPQAPATAVATAPATTAAPAVAPPDLAAPPPLEGAPWLRIQLSPELATLTGAAPDAATRMAVLSYAAAAFGAARLHEGLALAQGVSPPGWRAAALAGVDALAALESGEAMIADGRIDLTGATPDPLGARRAALALGADQGQGWRATSRVRVDLPARAAATRLPPERCARELTDIAAVDPILFAPSSAEIEGTSEAVLDRLAATLRRCGGGGGGGGITVEGHTDSQGSEGYNARLSQARAEAVRAALVARGAPQSLLGAQGFGESRPIADNATEAGRARNRRIAFAPRAERDADASSARGAESETP